jgi:GTPase KRas protein
VGKSALVIQFMQDYFVEDYDPTISDHYLKTTTIDETPFHIEIGDTAGLNLYEVHLLEDLRAANAAFIVVYAIDSRNSFRSIQYFMEKIWKQQCTHLVPIGTLHVILLRFYFL